MRMGKLFLDTRGRVSRERRGEPVCVQYFISLVTDWRDDRCMVESRNEPEAKRLRKFAIRDSKADVPFAGSAFFLGTSPSLSPIFPIFEQTLLR